MQVALSRINRTAGIPVRPCFAPCRHAPLPKCAILLRPPGLATPHLNSYASFITKLCWRVSKSADIALHPVEVVFEHLDPEIVTLVIDGETIETTPNHPFYEMVQVPGNADGDLIGIWTGAGELVEGDAIFTANGGVEGAEWGGQGREWLVLSLH